MMTNCTRQNALCAIGLLILLGGCSDFTNAPTPTLRLQTGRYGHSVVSDGSLLYVVGGSGPNGLLGDVEAIDPKTGKSEVITTDLVPRRYHSAIIKGKDIYIVGGQSRRGAESSVEIFNLESRSIRQAAPLPTPRRLSKSVIVGNEIYVIGGQDQKQLNGGLKERTAIVEVLDTAHNTWRRAPPMPTARECAVIASRDKIYTIGGYNGGETGLPKIEVYDVEPARWIAEPDAPFNLSAHSALLIKNNIFTFGDYKMLDRVARYCLRDQKWTVLDVEYEPSRHNAAVVVGREVFVVGGNIASSGSHLDLIQRYTIRELMRAMPVSNKASEVTARNLAEAQR
jgi:hypothetical protein